MTQRIPITILTGFLGSGKTTLLNAWLRSPALGQALVIVNEFGDIGIDHHLIANSSDNVIELLSGCLCCATKGELVDTLGELIAKRYRGEIRPFTHVIIETTGMADPVPIIQAMVTMPVVRAYQLQCILTTVDAVQGRDTVTRYPEALRQAVVADDIIVTKTDLCSGRPDALLAEFETLNPGAELHLAGADQIPPAELLLKAALQDTQSTSDDIRKWLRAEKFEISEHGHAHDHDHHHHDHAHASSVSSFCLMFDKPMRWDDVAAWLESLTIFHGKNLLRVKGLINVAGQKRPVVVQAVQQLFSKPFMLDDWPDGDERSRIVFITDGLTRGTVYKILEQIMAQSGGETVPVS